jgi:hypothetical protein
VTDFLTGTHFTPVSDVQRLLTLHAAEVPQKNELCGAFWGTLALRAASIDDPDAVNQDTVGMAAGSVLSADPSEGLPPGEAGRADFRLSFPTVDDPARSGTSVVGLVRAIGELSAQKLHATPVSGPWTPKSVAHVLHTAAGCNGPCTLIANVATRHFWGSRTSPSAVAGYLASGDPKLGAPPDWDVGHFVGLLGWVDGPRGTLVLVADTYRSMGWEGVYPQPIEALAAALARSDSGSPSGLVLVTNADEAQAVESVLRDQRLDIGTWDNGTPDMAHAVR